jgi:hypothetical protein
MTQLYQRTCSEDGKESTGSKKDAGMDGVVGIVRGSLIILRVIRQLQQYFEAAMEMRVRDWVRVGVNQRHAGLVLSSVDISFRTHCA